MRARLARVIIFGERAIGSGAVPSRLRGILVSLMQTGTNKADASGMDVTATGLNNSLASIYDNDQANMGDIAIYTGPIQARKMATFNPTFANRMQTYGFENKIAAGATSVTMFHSDLDAVGMPKLIVDINAPAGVIMCLNLPKINIVYAPSGRLKQWDSKPKDAPPDARQIGLIMQASLIMKDHTNSHSLIYNAKKVM